MRLAENGDFSAQIFVEPGQGSCTPDQPVTTLHHDIRIGADHEQLPVGQFLQPVPVVVGRFPLVVHKSGATDRFRLVVICGEGCFEVPVKRLIPVGPQMQKGFVALFLQNRPGHIARCHDIVVGLFGNTEFCKHLPDLFGRAWCVRDQYHLAAGLFPIGSQRLVCFLERCNPVVKHTPDIAQNPLVERSNGAKPVNQKRCRNGHVIHSDCA